MTDDDLKRLLDTNAAENRRHFDETVNRLISESRHFSGLETEGLRQDIQLVAEGVAGTREELARETSDIRAEMRRGFAETQAMIKFSHAELDSRVRALEQSQRAMDQTLTDMQARLERLESSTH